MENKLNELKLFALFYVNEHDQLSKKEKEIFYNFIKEANENQIYNLLYTGKMTNKDEALSEDLDIGPLTLTTKSNIDNYIFGSMAQAATAVVIVALATKLAIQTYKRFLSKAARACNKYSGQQKTSCMNKYKIDATKAKINILTKALNSSCPKSKNPQSCKLKLQQKINKEKAKLGQL